MRSEPAAAPPDVSAWPPGMLEIVEIVGAPAAQRLLDHLRGLEVYVPQPDFLAGRPQHTLARAMGLEAALLLAEHFGGQKIGLPTLRNMHSKRAQIAAATGTDNEVAARFGVSARYVRYCRRNWTDPRQLDMLALA